MRFLANENFPRPSLTLLRNHGLFVYSIQEECCGLPDDEVLEIARQQGLIILTLDRDYGEIIFRYGKRKPPAVIYFRNKGQQPEFPAKMLISLMERPEVILENAFTVVGENSIRQRFYTG